MPNINLFAKTDFRAQGKVFGIEKKRKASNVVYRSIG